MWESAPFVMMMILSSGVLTMTDIRFLAEVNSMTLSNSYFSVYSVNLL